MRFGAAKAQRDELLKAIYEAAKGFGDQPDMDENLIGKLSSIRIGTSIIANSDLHATLLILKRDRLINYVEGVSLTIARPGITRVENPRAAKGTTRSRRHRV